MMLFVLVLILGLLSSPTVVESKSAAGSLVVPQDDGRDPFSATKKMAKRGRRDVKDALDFSAGPSRNSGGTASLQLRGYIDSPGHQPRALIDVDGSGVYLVKQGDKISIQTGEKLVDLRVQSISKLSVRVRISGRTVIVR